MTRALGILALLTACACAQREGEVDFPQAEWDKARVILMHTPGHELFNGVIHPSAASGLRRHGRPGLVILFGPERDIVRKMTIFALQF